MDRVEAARERLTGLKRELSASDLFCVDCQFLRGANCLHPAVQSHSIDAVAGTVVSHPAPARSARSAEGACGPEAALFEPHPEPVIMAKAAWGGVQTGAALVVAALMLLGLLAQLVL